MHLSFQNSLRLFTGETATSSAELSTKIEFSKRGTPLWLSNYVPTPPVQPLPDGGKATALGWLYRRGPALPRGVLHKLFRQRQVRLLSPDGVTVTRAKKDTKLTAGERLFVPAAAVKAHACSPGWEEAPGTGGAPAVPPSRSRHPVQTAPFRAKDTVLHADRDMLVVNKPAGLPRRGDGVTVGNVYLPEAVGLRPSQTLVPATDLEDLASGVLALGKGERRALELSAAQRLRKPDAGGKDRDWACVPREVKVMYWALLDASAADVAAIERSGTLVLKSRGNRRGPPAEAAYR